MRKLILIISLSILISSVAVASEKSNSLILLNAKSQAETEEAISSLIENESLNFINGEMR